MIYPPWMAEAFVTLTPIPNDYENEETETNTCPDCRGTGQYVGLNTVEPCRTCQRGEGI